MSDLVPLREWLAAHPDPAESVAELRGGGVRHEDGQQIITLGYMKYASTLDDFWRALERAGADTIDTRGYDIVVDRWQAANGVTEIAAEHLAEMDRETLFNLLRELEQVERFCGGAWAEAYRDGMFQAAARAVLAMD